MSIKPLKDLDAGTLRHIDWQELLPAVMLFRALAQSLRLLPILGFSLLVSLWFQLGSGGCFLKYSPMFPRGCCDGICHSDIASRLGEVSTKSVFVGIIWLFLGLFFLLALARGAAVRLASSERSGLFRSMRFAARQYLSLLGGLFIPIFLAALCLFPCWLLSRFPSWVPTLCIPIPVLLTIVGALILVGVLLAFPLIIASAAVDRCDGFDAFSRSFSYLFRNPVHFACYAVIILVLGHLGFFALQWFAAVVLKLMAFCGVAGCPSMFDATVVRDWHNFWLGAVYSLPYGFAIVFFQTAFTALYIMLRRVTDDIPFDQFAADTNQKPRTLPPITADEQGAPVMAKTAGANGTDSANGATGVGGTDSASGTDGAPEVKRQ